MFQPMRKPDLVKMRRESLGTIMLKRKTDEAKLEMLKKKDSKTSLKSPLRLLSPLKRPAKDSLFSPCKLKRLSEEEKSPAPSSDDSRAPSSPTFVKPWSPAMRALTPIKGKCWILELVLSAMQLFQCFFKPVTPIYQEIYCIEGEMKAKQHIISIFRTPPLVF